MTKMNSISGLLKQLIKSNAVPLIVPKNIGKDLAPTALRYGISSTALSAFLASLINNSFGKTDDCSISKRSIFVGYSQMLIFNR